MDQANTISIRRTLTVRAKPSMALSNPRLPLPMGVDIVPLRQLTGDRKALKIAHGGATYVLQITKANKLILTKPKVDAKI